MFTQTIRRIVNRQALTVPGIAALVLVLTLMYGCAPLCPQDTSPVHCNQLVVRVPLASTVPGEEGFLTDKIVCVSDIDPTGDFPTKCPDGVMTLKLSQVPKPDLSYTTLDGLVDFGTTKLKVEVPAEGDSFETKLKGRVAMTGGICAEPQCTMRILLFELTSVQENLTTAKGKSVLDLFARNANIWTGARMSDGTIIMDATNKLSLEATIDGKKQAAVLNPNAWFKGALYYNVTRMTSTGPKVNNRIAITGNFFDNNIKAYLTISIWATNCEPVIQPSIECMPDIEPGFPGHVLLTSAFERLGNMQSSQDLCDALMAPDPVPACTAGGSDEFPTFTCKTQAQPPATTPAEIAKQLKFRWIDATGYVFSESVFSDKYMKTLHWMPVFPIKLTVENKWGKIATAEIVKAPQDGNCPKPTGLLAFGVVSSDGSKASGTPNWSSNFNSADKQYEITLSGEDYHHLSYSTMVTPTLSTSEKGFCISDSTNNKLLVKCYDGSGNQVAATFAFAGFKNPAGVVKGLLAFGVVSSDGSKASGTPNWSSNFNSADKQYEITLSGEDYHYLSYSTMVTPSFPTGERGFCTSNSVNNKLLVECYDKSGNPAVPGSFSFVSFKIPDHIGFKKGLVAFGVVSGGGKMESGTSNWSSSFNSADKQYEITISGENYYFLDYSTLVTPTFPTGERGFCGSSSVNGKLLIKCYDQSGSPVIPVSLAFATYRKP